MTIYIAEFQTPYNQKEWRVRHDSSGLIDYCSQPDLKPAHHRVIIENVFRKWMFSGSFADVFCNYNAACHAAGELLVAEGDTEIKSIVFDRCFPTDYSLNEAYLVICGFLGLEM